MFTTNMEPTSNCHTLSWSPLPNRNQKLHFTQYKTNTSSKIKKSSSLENLYPNCDVNVWLRSCNKEIIQPLNGSVTGIIPKWLRGTLLRNGPGSLKAGNEYFKHLFDSSALLHRFEINNGHVSYKCRFLKSEVYKRNWLANRIVLTEFGTQATVPDPCYTIFQRVAAIFNPNMDQSSDNSMISIYPFGDKIYAFGETPKIHEINKDTLETKNQVNVSDYVSIVHHTAHPHITSDGVYNLALSIYASGPHHTIVKFVPTNNKQHDSNMFKDAEIVAKFPVRWTMNPPYMHTFGITEHYFIIVEQPLSISLGSMAMTKIKNEPLAGCFRWYDNEMTQFNLIERTSGKLIYKFYSKAFFYLHIINQYEIVDFVIIDICIYQDPSMLDCMFIETMKTMQQNENYAKMFRSKPVRFVLPLNPKQTKFNSIQLPLFTKAQAFFEKNNIILVPEMLCNLGCETPRIFYEKFLGKSYQFFYAISADVDASNPGTIIKVDTRHKTTITWCEKNCYPSEPIFVPSPNCIKEDDGVVLAALVWGQNIENKAGLIILDAKNLKEIGRAEFQTESPVPKCLHGWFIPH